MRKTLLVLIIILTMGCAHQQTPVYKTPIAIDVKYNRIIDEILPCIELKNDMTFWIVNSQMINAWATKDNEIYFTEAIIRTFDDDTLKCIMCHEIAHNNLGHIANAQLGS